MRQRQFLLRSRRGDIELGRREGTEGVGGGRERRGGAGGSVAVSWK